ncbi:hypothetical protein AGMMS49579_24850 [Spirochaetia bacterium]|nr:hypothetical protein AGMMS49579_24850 [Spirochaetia bacterium]
MNKENSLEASLNTGPIIFAYVNDGFYDIGRSYLWYNEDNRYIRYFNNITIGEDIISTGIDINGKIATAIIDRDLSFDEFCEEYLVKKENASVPYYRVKILDEFYIKLKEQDNIYRKLDFERDNRPSQSELKEIYLAAQYCYDFIVFSYYDWDYRLYLPNQNLSKLNPRDRRYDGLLFIVEIIAVIVAEAVGIFIHFNLTLATYKKKKAMG